MLNLCMRSNILPWCDAIFLLKAGNIVGLGTEAIIIADCTIITIGSK